MTHILSTLKDLARTELRKRRFSSIIDRTVNPVSGWNSAEEVRGIAQKVIDAMRTAPSPNLRKGAPDLVSMKRVWATQLQELMGHAERSGQALVMAEQIASVDPRDLSATTLHLAVFWLHNEPVIQLLREIRAPYLALHMTCVARLDRARDSEASFASIPQNKLYHLKVVGNGQNYRFDPVKQVLEVPAADSYEHLADKVIDAYALLAIATRAKAVFKLDDDHRLGTPAALMRVLTKTARHREPVQLGTLHRLAYPAAHNRAWHFGKCKDQDLNTQPLAYPGPTSWVTGEHGYLLNRQALLRAAWAWLYYKQWLGSILYEDLALGEIADKLDIARLEQPMDEALSLHAHY